jgi:hypothetical protein
MNLDNIVDLFALGVFTLNVAAAVITKDDLKEIKYLAWAIVVLLANMSDNILRIT